MADHLSPRRNRVTPFGTFEAVAARGRLMGNRGCLAPGRLWRGRAWVCCRLSFRGRREALDSPRHYTPLFFADEVVALAAGHRPCGLCRPAAYGAFKAAFRRAFALDSGEGLAAAEMDRVLHAGRIRDGRPATHGARLGDLPDGTFVTLERAPERAFLLRGGGLLPWSHAGYGAPEPAAPGQGVVVLTPAPTVAVLKAGYVPEGLGQEEALA